MGEGFWRELAHGMAVEEERLAAWVAALHADGIVRGAWLEPNPMHPVLGGEALVHGALPDGAIARWSATTEDGPVHSACGAVGWASLSWAKVSCAPPLEEPHPETFAVEEDRTLMVLEGSREPEALSPAEEAALRALAAPVALVHPQTPLGLVAPGTRQDLAFAITKRAARRLAWNASPAALGFASGVLASWEIDDAQAPRAAAALARVRLAGDVAIRPREGGWGGNVTAVLWGRDAAEARGLARAIGEKWGMQAIVELELAWG